MFYFKPLLSCDESIFQVFSRRFLKQRTYYSSGFFKGPVNLDIYKLLYSPISSFYTRYIRIFDVMSEVSYASLKRSWTLENIALSEFLTLYPNYIAFY